MRHPTLMYDILFLYQRIICVPCGSFIMKHSQQYHNLHECPMRPGVCPHCWWTMPAKGVEVSGLSTLLMYHYCIYYSIPNEQVHIKVCKFAPRICPNKCGKFVKPTEVSFAHQIYFLILSNLYRYKGTLTC